MLFFTMALQPIVRLTIPDGCEDRVAFLCCAVDWLFNERINVSAKDVSMRFDSRCCSALAYSFWRYHRIGYVNTHLV
jgi:hypothetical protein